MKSIFFFFCVMLRTLEFQQGLLLEREDRIKNIEGKILDVNQIMRELAALSHQQGETISMYFPFNYVLFKSII